MRSDRICPRDKKVLLQAVVGSATVEICGACAGTFFDADDLVAAGGVIADPSTWDRAETGGAVKPSALACPHCTATMDAQDVTHEGKHVEVDRCGKCRGVWLDKGELDTLVAIGNALHAVIEAERAKAREELAALEQTGGFGQRSPAQRKMVVFGAIALVVAAVAGVGIYRAATAKAPPPRRDQLEGCPCGCDRSGAMAAELRRNADAASLATIEATLGTIGTREEAGYITERMVQHRLRMLDVAGEITERRPELSGTFPELERLSSATAQRASTRCRSPRIERDGLRVCTELALHGERLELVRGEEKLIGSSFRLWLEIENLGAAPRTVGAPSIDARTVRFPVTRWYREGTAGRPFDGVLQAGERVHVNVIGDVPDHVLPGASVDATIHVDALTARVTAEARAVIHVGR